NGGEPKPVMVWIHGGSHNSGAGSDQPYQSDGLVEKGVVLVTINYRLGALGYLAHPALSAESPQNSSGNYGLLDQIKALEWVQANIAKFGGDPGNITLFGESAGAQSITEIMASPLGDGLYHKAILQSGSSTYNRIHLSRDIEATRSAEAVGEDFLAPLLADGGRGATAAQLRDVPGTAIIDRVPDAEALTGYFLPNVDGWVLPRMIGTTIEDGSALKVPVLAGYNADEGTLFYSEDLAKPTVLHPGAFPNTHTARLALMDDIYGEDRAARLISLYGMETEADWHKGAVDMLGDDIFGVHMRFLAKANARRGQPTWAYFFTRTPASPTQTLGAFHASDLAFVFDSHHPFLEATEADFSLTDAMGTYWTNFAKTGDPNGNGLPAWPAYTETADTWMHLDHTLGTLTGVRSGKLDIMEAVLREKLAMSAALSIEGSSAPVSSSVTEEQAANALQP
ncbi:MAG: carboxylesterase family protein, partial [Pseudomonadota bacterium]